MRNQKNTEKLSSITSPYNLLLEEGKLCLNSTRNKELNIRNMKTFSYETRADTSTNKKTINLSSVINQKLKSLAVSKDKYLNYVNKYARLTQNFCFKSPNILSYPIKKNKKFLPITSKSNETPPKTEKNNNSNHIFLSYMSDSNSKTNKVVENKPYGYKYGETKIVLEKKNKSFNLNTVGGEDFQDLYEGKIFDSELLNQIGIKNMDLYNNLEEKYKNFKFLKSYLLKFNNITDDIFNINNCYKSIQFQSRSAINKQNIIFKMSVSSMCLKFFSLENIDKPQKLYLPYQLLPYFYLLDFHAFKLFLSEIIHYDYKNKCFSFIKKQLLQKTIKYYNYIFHRKDANDITYYKNELGYHLVYDWIVLFDKLGPEEDSKYDHKCYKLKISLPKIRFNAHTYQISIVKVLNKNIFALLLQNKFKDWEKFILFDLFSYKKFKIAINDIMLNKIHLMRNNKINLDNKFDTSKELEFFITQRELDVNYYYIFVPYIVLLLYGIDERRFQKIYLTLHESKIISKFNSSWGLVQTLLKCMFINPMTNNIYFKFDALENIDKKLYETILKENIKLKKSFSKKISSKNNLFYASGRNKNRYRSNELEITILDCSLKRIFMSDNGAFTKYYKVPEKLLNIILNKKTEKNLKSSSPKIFSKISKYIGECSDSILESPEENIVHEEVEMKKRTLKKHLLRYEYKTGKSLFNEKKATNKKYNKLKQTQIEDLSATKKKKLSVVSNMSNMQFSGLIQHGGLFSKTSKELEQKYRMSSIPIKSDISNNFTLGRVRIETNKGRDIKRYTAK